MSALITKTAAELAEALAAGETTSVELTRAHLDRIAEVDGVVHAFLHVDAEGALAQAAESDARRAAGSPASYLDGVPIAVKDVLATEGLPTTCGSKILEGWVPPYVGFTPTVPVTAPGWRIEPPVSVPIASGASKAATAAAEPPPEPPGIRSRSHGLWVAPYAECSVELPMANSSMLVLPRIGRPASRSLRTTVAS